MRSRAVDRGQVRRCRRPSPSGTRGGWLRRWAAGCAILLGWTAGGFVAAQPPDRFGAGVPPLAGGPQAGPPAAVAGMNNGTATYPTAALPKGPANAEVLPAPRPVPPFGPDQVRLPTLGCPPVLGCTPVCSPAAVAKANRVIQGVIDPDLCLDLNCGKTRLLLLKTTPKRVQVADECVACYTLVTPTQLSLQGRNVGSTVLTLWFADPADSGKEIILTYNVRVMPDPELKARLDRVYKALAEEINHAFPDSNVCLSLVGDKLVVTGFAKDIIEATQILKIVRANAPGPNRSPVPESAFIPVNRYQNGRGPGELGPDGLPLPGLENYVVSGSSNVINLLRVNGEQQVMLRVTVAEVNRAAARSIGLNFNVRNHQGVTVFGQETGAISSGGLTPGYFTGGLFGLGAIPLNSGLGISPIPGTVLGAGGFNNLPATLDNGQVGLAISALRDLNYARSLAEPNLVTMNGQTANFQAGGQFPVPTVSGYTGFGLQGVNFVPYGVQLSFTPYVTDRDRIRLVVSASVSARDLDNGYTTINGAGIPNLVTRNFNTTVELREGQTLAVAGLIQNNLGADATRVPFFGDLPFVGHLFGFDRITAGEQELVVLITPELVHPLEPKEVPPLPGSDIFEPGDLEFYLLGRLESRRPYDYRSPVMTDCARMSSYRHCEQLYIIGPHGTCDH